MTRTLEPALIIVEGPSNKSIPTNVIPKSSTPVSRWQLMNFHNSGSITLRLISFEANTQSLFVTKANTTALAQAMAVLGTLGMPEISKQSM